LLENVLQPAFATMPVKWCMNHSACLKKRTEEQRVLKLERLRSAVRAGNVAVADGDFVDVNSDDELDTLFARL